jgi:hypothetical protein
MELSDAETLTKLKADLTNTDLRSVFECFRPEQQQDMISCVGTKISCVGTAVAVDRRRSV